MKKKVKALSINTTVTVVINDKSYVAIRYIPQILSLVDLYNTDPNEDVLKALMRYLTPEELKKKAKIVKAKKELQEKEEKLKEIAKEKVSTLETIKKEGEEIFDIKETGEVFLKGFNIRMPDLLVDRIRECINQGEDFSHFINFWKLCMLNPNPVARHDLFKYISLQNLVITPMGYFVTYRRVRTFLKEEKDLVAFVTEQVTKVKRWKKSPKNYVVIEGEETNFSIVEKDKVSESVSLGNLADLHESVTSMASSIYTDDRTGTFRIRIGFPVRERRDKCDSNNRVECSFGLHTGTPQFVKGGGFGDTIIACLINPMHVVAVPYADAHKMRSCEYFPFAVISDEEEMEALDQSGLIKFEHDYCAIEVDMIDSMLKETKLEDYSDSSLGLNVGDNIREEMKSLQETIKLSEDNVSQDLPLSQINSIIQSRKVLIDK